MAASGVRALYELPAPAKLNAFLHLVGRRADGYHLLESVFVLIDWADTLHLERRTDGQLRRHDLGMPLPADDLCLKAARALQSASATTLGVDISIVKRVPHGAGMGGGSSDAATVLLGLNHLWGLHWPRAKLQALALNLGADVPFFIAGNNAFVKGVGEQLMPIEWPEAMYEVVKPPAALATPAVFGHPAKVVDASTAILAGSLVNACGTAPSVIQGHVGRWFAGVGANHLQAAAEQLCPEVTLALRWLHHRHGNSRMTGSGSAVFAKVGAADMPKATSLEELPPGWANRMCRSLPHHPLRGWAG